jgi:hypothetical protein
MIDKEKEVSDGYLYLALIRWIGAIIITIIICATIYDTIDRTQPLKTYTTTVAK